MIKFNDISDRLNDDKIISSFKRVLNSGRLILGDQVSRFEKAFSNYLKIKYCVSVGNGSDAIEIALKSIGVQFKDKVATVANAGAYTTTSVLSMGATPIFMDIDKKTLLTTFQHVQKAYNQGAKAIVITHLFGVICPDISKISKFCNEKNILLVEDCAQCHGVEINGKKAGTFGDIACFSFYPTKNLGALGDGGAIVTNNKNYAKKSLSLRQYGWSTKYCLTEYGGRNSRLDELQAAVLLLFLPKLDHNNNKRRLIAQRYNDEIKNDNVLLPTYKKNESVFHLYVIRTKKRDSLQKYLLEHKITSAIHYPIPDHKQPIIASMFNKIKLPVTEKNATEILSLPCNEFLNDKQVTFIISAINNWIPK